VKFEFGLAMLPVHVASCYQKAIDQADKRAGVGLPLHHPSLPRHQSNPHAVFSPICFPQDVT